MQRTDTDAKMVIIKDRSFYNRLFGSCSNATLLTDQNNNCVRDYRSTVYVMKGLMDQGFVNSNGGSWITERGIVFMRRALVSAHGVKNEENTCVVR